jgi:hypothetical protein
VTNKPAAQVVSPNILTIHITPAGYLRYASQFLAAARASRAADPDLGSHVPHYLTCHAIELALKAFLRVRQVPSQELKDVPGHDLKKILKRCDDRHLSELVVLSEEQRGAIIHANKYYKAKVLEYFSRVDALKGYVDLPDLSILDGAAQILLEGLKAPCAQALFPEGTPLDVIDPL